MNKIFLLYKTHYYYQQTLMHTKIKQKKNKYVHKHKCKIEKKKELNFIQTCYSAAKIEIKKMVL